MAHATFRALLAERSDDGAVTTTERILGDDFLLADDELADGDLLVDVEHSSLNYKDGLAVLGRPGVIRDYPLIPGIDVVGVVEASRHPDWAAGDRVIVNGAGLGEFRHGGYAERAVVPGAAAVPVPPTLSAWAAAALGTAGDTAALSVLALERAGVRPDDGDVLVTGSAGGVGTVAVALLARAGFRVIASTGRLDEHGDALRALGAAEVVDRAEFAEPGRPLQRARFAGAIDSVGSVTLANVLAQTRYGGAVTCCGLAQGADLPATVMPFILRGVSLLGINSVETPRERRGAAWRRLGDGLDEELIRSQSREIGFAQVLPTAERILAGQVRGRTVVTP